MGGNGWFSGGNVSLQRNSDVFGRGNLLAGVLRMFSGGISFLRANEEDFRANDDPLRARNRKRHEQKFY